MKTGKILYKRSFSAWRQLCLWKIHRNEKKNSFFFGITHLVNKEWFWMRMAANREKNVYFDPPNQLFGNWMPEQIGSENPWEKSNFGIKMLQHIKDDWLRVMTESDGCCQGIPYGPWNTVPPPTPILRCLVLLSENCHTKKVHSNRRKNSEHGNSFLSYLKSELQYQNRSNSWIRSKFFRTIGIWF